jgi:hypothetical protein
MWKKCFSWPMNVHGISDVRQMETFTAKQSVPEHSHVKVYIPRYKLNRYKSPGMDQIPEELIWFSVFIIMTASVV